MKYLFLFIFMFIILSGCKNNLSNTKIANEFNADTVFKGTVQENMPDTLVKISKPFKLNGSKCFWQHQIVNNGELIIKLFDFNTNKLLLNYLDSYHSKEYSVNDYFGEINKETLQDVNFDGFTDITFRSYGSMPMNDLVDIYIYSKQRGVYMSADDLSANRIIDIDEVNRRLIMSNEFLQGTDTIIHYFDKDGKIKYTDEVSNYHSQEDTTWIAYKTYKKIVNGETVKERTTRDTIKWN